MASKDRGRFRESGLMMMIDGAVLAAGDKRSTSLVVFFLQQSRAEPLTILAVSLRRSRVLPFWSSSSSSSQSTDVEVMMTTMVEMMLF